MFVAICEEWGEFVGGMKLVARGLAVALVLGSLSLGLVWVPTAQGAVVTVNEPCDAIVSNNAEPGFVTAPQGSIVLLGDDLDDTSPWVHECDPTFDEVTGELLTGNGIAIAAEKVTFDLNGHSIRSTSNVAEAGDALGLDVENAGVSAGGKFIIIKNSHTSMVSRIEEFTANFDLKAEDSTLRGYKIDHDGNSATARVYNLVGGNAHGGGASAIDKSKRLVIDTVELTDLSIDGDNGIDLKRSESITIKNSLIHGILTGIRARFSKSVTIMYNTILTGAGGTGVEILSDESVTIKYNTIRNTAVGNLDNGVVISGNVKSVSIFGNTFVNWGGCAIEINVLTGVTVGTNTYTNVATNVC